MMVAPYLSKLLKSWHTFKRMLGTRSQSEGLQISVTASFKSKPVAQDLVAYYPRPFMRSVPPGQRARLLEILVAIEREAADRRNGAKVEALTKVNALRR